VAEETSRAEPQPETGARGGAAALSPEERSLKAAATDALLAEAVRLGVDPERWVNLREEQRQFQRPFRQQEAEARAARAAEQQRAKRPGTEQLPPPQPSPPGGSRAPVVVLPPVFGQQAADDALARLKQKAESRKQMEAAPVAPGRRTVEGPTAEELAAQRKARAEVAAARPPPERNINVAATGTGWRPPRAEPVEPVLAGPTEGYTFADAVKDAGGLSAPLLDDALAAMRKGKSAAEVVADWSGGTGEHDELAGILEEVADARDSQERVRYRHLRQAYAKAFAFNEPGGSDKTLAGLHDMVREGTAPVGRMPEDEGDLYRRQWEFHSAPAEQIDRDATAIAQEEADYGAFANSLELRQDGLYSGEQKLGEVRAGAFVPTVEGERLPPEYQLALLAKAGIEGPQSGEIGMPTPATEAQARWIKALTDKLHERHGEFMAEYKQTAGQIKYWGEGHPRRVQLTEQANYLQGRMDEIETFYRNFTTEGEEIYGFPQQQQELGGGELPRDYDPTVLRDLTSLAGRVIEQGNIEFPAYARAMHTSLAGEYQPYYHAAYNQVREYTEAQALRNRLTPREEIENYDSTGQFTGGAGSPAGGDDAARIATQLSGTTGGGGVRRRPGLRVVDEGDLPTPRPIVRSGEYQGPKGAAIDETQRFAVNLALTAFEDGKAAFLLGDGTGVGKTGSELVIAAQTALRTKLPSLIITQSRQIIENRFREDMAKFGVPSQGIEFGTYDDLSRGKSPAKEYGVVIYDEAHNLKNAGSLREAASQAINARHKIFATATPMDSPSHAAYFLSQLTGRTKRDIANALGYHYEMRTARDGQQREFAVLNREMNWEKVIDNIRGYRTRAVQGGQLVRREYPFYGRAALREAPEYTPEQKREQSDIVSYWDNQIEGARPGSNYRRNLAGQKTLELGRWAEIQKLPHILKAVESDLSAGKYVVVFAEGIRPTRIKGLGRVVSGFLEEMGKALDARGIKYAKVFGDTPEEKGRAAQLFQTGKVRALLATPRSGGAGLDMDDIFGDRPRSAHAATLNFSADVFDQMVGRVSRRNTASPSDFAVWHNRESFSDGRRVKVADRKLRVLRNIQAGEDLDTSDFEREEVGMPAQSDPFSFEPAESDAEQAARLQAEEERSLKAAATRRMQAQAGQRLTGTAGDLGQGQMFGGAEDLWGRDIGAPSIPPGGVADLPVEMTRAAEGSVSLPQIIVALENVSRAAGGQTPIRTGRFYSKNRAIYKEMPEVVRLRGIDDIPAAAHEIGHDLAKQVLNSVALRSLKAAATGPAGNAAAMGELEKLGRQLYGDRHPVAGYVGEGWAEFLRGWLSTDDVATRAPKMNQWFEQTFLPANPKIAAALSQARSLITTWRLQGAQARGQAQLQREPGEWARITKALATLVSYQGQVESFAPLEKASTRAAQLLGRPLAPSEDPYLLASWKRGSAGATVERMVENHMIDLYGNPTGPGLREIFAPLRGQRAETMLFIFGKAALARWRQGKNPGISRADADYLVSRLDTPQRAIAAQRFQEWQRGLLNYVIQADPAMADVVKRFNVDFYAPLARMIDPARAKAAAAAAASNPFFTMRGSALPVKDIFDQTIRNANRLVARANRALVTNALVKLANIEGMGHIIERVPRGRVRRVVNVEQIRQQLTDMGADLTNVTADEMLNYWTPADMPKGTAPIVAVGSGRNRAWYQVDPDLYETLDGLQAFSLKNAFPSLPGLSRALDLLVGGPARTFRLGTTGLRGSFGLVTRPLRNLPLLLIQGNVKNPAAAAASWPVETAGILRAAINRRESPYAQAFRDLGAESGQPLGLDMGYTTRVSDGLFHGRILTTVKHPLDHLRQLFHLPDTGLRVAALRSKAREIGWTPGTPISPDQAVQMGLEGKRALVDFTASGEVSRVLNQAIPFYNPIIQHVRGFGRAFEQHPVRTTLLGLGLLTAPTLYNWWRNKDKEWWSALPWRERSMFTYVDDGKHLWRISRPYEYGEAFMVMPEALLDSWYRQDPAAVEQGLSSVFHESNPLDWPASIRGLKEQWQNRIAFWNRPIVPPSEEKLTPGQQVGPYTTRLARTLGQAFPSVSPRRVDAAVNAYFGGAADDALNLLGLGASTRGRQKELSDIPVLGTLWRRGGEFNAQNEHVLDFWDAYNGLQQKVEGARFAVKQTARGLGGNPPPATSLADIGRLQVAEKAAQAIKVLMYTADRTKDEAARSTLYREAGRIAQDTLNGVLKPVQSPETDRAAQLKALVQPLTARGLERMQGQNLFAAWQSADEGQRRALAPLVVQRLAQDVRAKRIDVDTARQYGMVIAPYLTAAPTAGGVNGANRSAMMRQ